MATRAALGTRPAISLRMETSSPACSFLYQAEMSGSRSLLISGGILRNWRKSARFALATCPRAPVAPTWERARAAQGWLTWKATCVGRPLLIARNHSSARGLSPPVCLRREVLTQPLFKSSQQPDKIALFLRTSVTIPASDWSLRVTKVSADNPKTGG